MHDLFLVESKRRKKKWSVVGCKRRVESEQLKLESIRLTMWKCRIVETILNVKSMRIAIVKHSTNGEYRGLTCYHWQQGK